MIVLYRFDPLFMFYFFFVSEMVLHNHRLSRARRLSSISIETTDLLGRLSGQLR